MTLYSTSVQLRDNAIFYGSTVHSDSDFIQCYIQYSSETMRFCTALQYSTTVQLRDNVHFYSIAHAYATDCTVHTPELIVY